jgi:hypothetical protein
MTLRSVDQSAHAWRDADQKIGWRLLYGDHLDDACRGLLGRSVSIEEFLCATLPVGIRWATAFNRRHRIEAHPRKRGDVS